MVADDQGQPTAWVALCAVVYARVQLGPKTRVVSPQIGSWRLREHIAVRCGGAQLVMAASQGEKRESQGDRLPSESWSSYDRYLAMGR